MSTAPPPFFFFTKQNNQNRWFHNIEKTRQRDPCVFPLGSVVKRRSRDDCNLFSLSGVFGESNMAAVPA